jgi:hypothetical protein
MKKILIGAMVALTALLFFNIHPLFAKGPGKGETTTSLDSMRQNQQDSLQRSPGSITKTHHIQKRWTRFNGDNNSFTILPLELLLRTFHVSYTRYFFKQRIGIGVEGSYTFKLSDKKQFQNSDLFNINGPTQMIRFMPFSDGTYASVFAKVYVEDKTPLNFFFSVTAFYRNTRFNNGIVKWEEPAGSKRGVTENYQDSLNVDQYHQGLKILFGINPVIPLGKVSLDLEAYVGLSVRNVQTTLYHHDYYCIVSDEDTSVFTPGKHQIGTNLEEKSQTFGELLPAAGIKVGIRF